MFRIPEPVLTRIKDDLESYRINFPVLCSKDIIKVWRIGKLVDCTQISYLEEGISKQIDNQLNVHNRTFGVYHCGTNNDEGVLSPTVHYTMFRLTKD